MSDKLLATLATTTDIEAFLQSKTWEPMVLTPQMREVGRIEIINVANCRATHGFNVKHWQPIDEKKNLFAPIVGAVDCYFDPLQFKTNLAQDLSQRVFGNPVGTAMHLLHEPHMHEMDIWTEVNDSERAYEGIISNCAQNSRDFRDMNGFSNAMSFIHEAVKDWESKIADGTIEAKFIQPNTWGVIPNPYKNWVI